MIEPLTARTAPGDLLGIQRDGVVQFRGVPYAMAPVGELRFAPPRPVAAWSGVRDAQQHGPVAPQLPSRLSNVIGNFTRPQSEDCLTLTISTPAIDGRARPVLVWLHGGAFMAGAGSLDWYDGATLAREGDLVVVSVNYRLGALGFLYQPGISSGRQGVLDMVAALEWVNNHIAAFGGDPRQVCVMGQSAGAHSIMCMLTMPQARRLFQRAILQSAPAGMPPFSEDAALERSNRLLDLLNIERSSPAAIAARLKDEESTPAELLLEATTRLAQLTSRNGDFTPPFLPMFDELATPQRFIEAAAEGAGVAHIDLIIGTTREETHAFLCSSSAMQEPDPTLLARSFAALTGEENAIERYRSRRPASKPVELLSDLITDHSFLFPSLRFVEAATQAGARAWVYQFDWAPSGSPLKACHCLELPFVFGNPQAWNDSPMLQGADPAVFADLSMVMRRAWISFVKSGNPGTDIAWPRYQSDKRETMRFASVVGPVGDLAGVSWRNRFVS